MVAMQVIWRGKSARCQPRVPPPPGVLMTHAVHKVQTRDTFLEFIQFIQRQLVNVRQDAGLDAGEPAVVVLDNVVSHCMDGMALTSRTYLCPNA